VTKVAAREEFDVKVIECDDYAQPNAVFGINANRPRR
jgi:ABC-type metal ion transport system substrate-binding protein